MVFDTDGFTYDNTNLVVIVVILLTGIELDVICDF